MVHGAVIPVDGGYSGNHAGVSGMKAQLGASGPGTHWGHLRKLVCPSFVPQPIRCMLTLQIMSPLLAQFQAFLLKQTL